MEKLKRPTFTEIGLDMVKTLEEIEQLEISENEKLLTANNVLMMRMLKEMVYIRTDLEAIREISNNR